VTAVRGRASGGSADKKNYGLATEDFTGTHHHRQWLAPLFFLLAACNECDPGYCKGLAVLYDCSQGVVSVYQGYLGYPKYPGVVPYVKQFGPSTGTKVGSGHPADVLTMPTLWQQRKQDPVSWGPF
jgi:hypothetical protein